MAVPPESEVPPRIQEARKLSKKGPAAAESIYRDILSTKPASTPAALSEYEAALLGLGELYRDGKKVNELSELVKSSTSSLSSFTKAKTAKLVRQLLDLFPSDASTVPIQISTTKSCIEWAVSERRSFLRQSLETRLVALYMQQQSYYDALGLINNLLKELKRLDDKLMLVEVQLLESRVYHALGNQAKARAALTSARTSAASVYTPPLLQSGLDMQSGMLHAEDRDFNTAFSYFIEALEGYMALDDHAKATSALMYMLLCKIMLNLPDDVTSILTSKSALKLSSSSSSNSTIESTGSSFRDRRHSSNAVDNGPAPDSATGEAISKSESLPAVTDSATTASKTSASAASAAARNLEAMKSIARAHAHRSLEEYEVALHTYRAELGSDVFIKRHLVRLYDAMLEQNLLKVIEPFSRVEISHIAKIVGGSSSTTTTTTTTKKNNGSGPSLGPSSGASSGTAGAGLNVQQIERKLSQMILDKQITGVLDQGSGCLIVYAADSKDEGYAAALETIKKLEGVVEGLYEGQASLLE